MDANKLKKFHEVAYGIQRSCQLCKHSSFKTHSPWGSCNKHMYEHLKHTDSHRHLSIYRTGVCADYEPGHEVDVLPEPYKELIV